ncbi:MAG: hypothetical protein WDZ88_00240 [Candidatus Paceibacterota bacterium]
MTHLIERKSIVRISLITGLLLLIPLILQLTIGTGVDGQGFNWKLGDFLIIGALIFITGLALEATRKLKPKHRIIAIIVVILLFLLTWTELAVGILGTPFAGS